LPYLPKNVNMVILLYGEDSYRSRQKLNEIIEHYKSIHKSGMNLKYFEGKDLNLEDLKEEFRQTSMFDEKKLLVVNDVFSNGDFKEKFLKNQKEILDSKDVIVLFYNDGIPKDEQFLKFLKLKADCQEFKPLKGESLRVWLKKEFADYQTDISPEAQELLINFVGNDIWQLSNEIKKLVSYRAPHSGAKVNMRTEFSPPTRAPHSGAKVNMRTEFSPPTRAPHSGAKVNMRTEFSSPTRAPRREAKRQALSLSSLSLRESLMGEDGKENEVLFGHKNRQKIEVADVRLLVKSKIESDIFKTIDAISQKNKKQAIFLIHKHLETGDSPHYLLSMINFQFRNLLIIKDLIEKNRPYYAILKISKLHPFVVKKSYQEANKFTFPELKKIYQKIFQVDLDIKTGRVSPEAALDLFLAGI